MLIFCHNCGKKTNHSVLAKEEREFEGEYFPYGENHYFAKCDGCNALTYAIETWSEDCWDPKTEELVRGTTWKTYPRGATERKPIDDKYDLPAKIRAIYHEVVGAINAQLPVLASIGLRAVIEAICNDQGIKGNDLGEKIDRLDSNGVLSKAQAEILHLHRFLGNVAAHEIISAKPQELVAAIEIAENMIRTIYINPILSKQIKTGRIIQ
jgi:hypothetical protein